MCWKTAGPGSIMGDFCQIIPGTDRYPVLFKLFQKIEKEGMSPN